jgi:hypothetical protein
VHPLTLFPPETKLRIQRLSSVYGRKAMFSKPLRSINTEVMVFTSSEYDNEVVDFQEGVNSWLKAQPDNIVIEDIMYNHSGLTSRGKDIISMVIVSRPATAKELE